MFVGHFGAACLLRGIFKTACPLWALFLGSQLIDYAYFILALAGVEVLQIDGHKEGFLKLHLTFAAYTHSLITTASAIAACWLISLLGFLVYRYRTTPDLKKAGAWALGWFVFGISVGTHWLLDYFTHTPDLALLPVPAAEQTRGYYGLGLWTYIIIAYVVEAVLTIGCYLVMRFRVPTKRIWRRVEIADALPISLIVALTIIYWLPGTTLGPLGTPFYVSLVSLIVCLFFLLMGYVLHDRMVYTRDDKVTDGLFALV
jgi:hypothetical protein